MKALVILTLVAAAALFTFFSNQQKDVYVSIEGNDSAGDGSKNNPWRTIHFAVTKIQEGQTIKLSEGIFSEEPFIVPPGVNIEGEGKTRTIIKANPSFYYNPPTPGFAPEKFLIHFSSPEETEGNQHIKHLMIDGENKRLHGGIYVNKRTDLTIDDIRIQNTNFNGLWLWDAKDVRIANSELKDCSWGSFEWCNGALNLGSIENVEIDNCTIDESVAYGIKGLGQENAKIVNLNIHHSHISVNPKGLWNNGTAPNISIELFNVENSEIHHCYLDNHISVAGPDSLSDVKTVRIHHNTIDLNNRAEGNGYGIELNINNVEVDNNYFIRGSYGIVNWGAPKHHWDIHHNIFYGLKSIYPTDIIRSQTNGLHHVKLYNNTIELVDEKQTVNLMGVYGGASDNISIMNNLVVSANEEQSPSLNEIIHTENGATLAGVEISNNFFETISPEKLKPYAANNYTGDGGIIKSGTKPMPYYTLKQDSRLIDAGRDVGFAYEGKLPDVGAYEYKN